MVCFWCYLPLSNTYLQTGLSSPGSKWPEHLVVSSSYPTQAHFSGSGAVLASFNVSFIGFFISWLKFQSPLSPEQKNKSPLLGLEFKQLCLSLYLLCNNPQTKRCLCSSVRTLWLSHWILRAFSFHSLLHKCKSLLTPAFSLFPALLLAAEWFDYSLNWCLVFRLWVRFQGLHFPPLCSTLCLLPCVLLTFPESWSTGIPEHLTAAAHLHLLYRNLLQIIAPRFAGNHWSFGVFSSCLSVLPPPLVLYFFISDVSCEPHLFLLLFC